MRPPRLSSAAAGLLALALLTTGLYAAARVSGEEVVCPPGTIPTSAQEPMIVPPDQQDLLPPEYRGPGGVLELTSIDCRPSRLESFTELATRNAQNDARISAPFMQPAEGARWSAAQERAAMIAAGATVPGSDGEVTQYGEGPLNFDEDPYDSGQGIVDSTGRIDDYFHDEASNRLFAAIGTSGVWLSEDLGESWRSIGDALPSQVTSAVSWSPSGGPDGTVVVLTGEHTFGGASFTGIGAFWSTDLGETWQRAEGPPDGTLGFAIEVDPTDPDVVYAATGKGLWRSEDAGRTYVDVVLPVGPCEGDYNIETCNYAHFVTDVVIKAPGGTGADTEGGTVLAAVGYRGGMLEDVSGEFIHSEGNGLYRSDSGAPGTFDRLDGLDTAVGGRERLGRVEMGPAVGPEQDHDIVYAVVQDAVLFNGGAQYVPIPDGVDPTGLVSQTPTFLNGIYVSEDWGQTWTQLAEDTEVSTLCTVNQSVFCIPGAIEPGIQSWYNMWIAPDPTRAVDGVPTRLVFGLEEVFQNRLTNVPANTPLTSFEVIGAYYGGVDCLLVITDCVVSSNLGITTTHPDQHDGIFIPTLGEDGEPDGGVRLLVGHDGGISSQVSTGPLSEFSQRTWNLEQENGLDTLLPYSIAVANDGTALGGLQDNGTMLIDPTRDSRLFEVQGADGTATAIAPEDSDYGYASSQTNSLLAVSSDRFETFTSLTPTPASNFLFVPPLDMNPLDSDHIITGGTQVIENLAGREATSSTWSVAIDLGSSDREPLYDTDVEPPVRQTSATALYGDAAYVGFCAPCNILQTPYPYDSGIATNIGSDELPEPGTDAGWHIAGAAGLPERYVTDLAIDPYDPTGQTVYATLGGYTRKWVPPGTGADEAEAVGEGHVFVSTDAGETFRDISGNLPDTPVLTVEQRGDQLLVGTDLGAFISSDLAGTAWAPLGGDTMPTIPVMDIQLQADDPDVAYLGVYGRGVMRYEFPADAAAEIRRLAGPDRDTTAVAISQDQYETSDTVVLARSDEYADALAGAPLAHDRDAPLLLTGSDLLTPVVADEIERLGATTAVLLGGSAALSPQLEASLSEHGITEVERHGGPNRFATAGLIAGQLGDTATAWIVKGNDTDPTRGWPDAMSIAPVAARAGQPILLTETERLPEETIAALEDISRARLVGGTAAISDPVTGQIGELVTLGDRVAGDNRYATSVAAAQVGLANGHSMGDTWLARADAFADALSAGPSVAATGGSLLLVQTESLEASLESGEFLTERACDINLVRIAGGEQAISGGVESELRALLDACPVGVPTPPDQAIVPVEGEPGEEPGEVVAGPFGFEEDEQGWTVEGGDPLTGTWTRGAPGHESDTSFQVSGYGDAAATSLVSPEIEVDGGPVTLSWWWALQMEGGGYDEVAAEWTGDGGETWTQLAALGKTGEFPAFSEAEATFTAEGGTIQVRFRLFADEICSALVLLPGVCSDTALDGAYVDAVRVLQ